MKTRFLSLIAAVLLPVFAILALLPAHTFAAISTNSTVIQNKAIAACAANAGFGSSDYAAYSKTAQGEACIGAFTAYYKNPSSTASPTYCKDHYFQQQSSCSTGLTLGAAVRSQDAKSGGTNPTSTNTTDSQLAKQANTSQTCGNNDSSCIAGYIAGYKGTPSENTACKSGATISGYKVTNTTSCKTGYAGGSNDRPSNATTVGTQSAVDAANGTSSGSSGKDTDTTPECEASGFSLAWILCPIFNMFSDTAHWIFQSVVQPFLITTPISTQPDDPSYQIWSNFRIYGDIFLIIGLLVIVFGQTIGGGVVDAYTAKKVLPRLLAAAILINLSIYIVAFLVDITNVLGEGVSNLLTAPLTHCSSAQISGGNCWDFRLSNTDIVSVFGVGLIGFIISSTAIVGFLGALFFGGGAAIGTAALTALLVSLPMIFAAIGVFITLIFRKGLILFLVLISPVAFALYCLPNTEKYFRRWWELLIEALMVYPIVIVIFGVADILTITILSANNISPSSLSGHLALDASRTLALIVAFMLQFLPLLAIPFAFRFASGALRRIYDAATTAGAKANQLANNRREQAKMDWKSNTLAARARSYQNLQGLGARDTSRLGIGRRLANMGARRAGGYNIEALMSAARAEKAKQLNDQIATGRDEEIRGLTVNKAKALQGKKFLKAAGTDANGDTIWRDGATNEVVSGAAMEQYDYRVNENGSRDFQSLGGAWVGEGAVDAGHRRWGRDQLAQQAALSYEMRKGITDNQRARIKNQYLDLATSSSGWGMSGSEARGAWVGSSFENQGTNLEYKYTKFNSDGSVGTDYDGLVTEIDEKRGSYDMSRMDAGTIDRLTDAWAGSAGNPERQAKLHRIALTMQDRMQRAGTGPEVTPGEDGQPGMQAAALGAGHVSQRMSEFVDTVLNPNRNP